MNPTMTSATQETEHARDFLRSHVNKWKAELSLAELKAERIGAELQSDFKEAADELQRRGMKLEYELERLGELSGAKLEKAAEDLKHSWKKLHADTKAKLRKFSVH